MELHQTERGLPLQDPLRICEKCPSKRTEALYATVSQKLNGSCAAAKKQKGQPISADCP